MKQSFWREKTLFYIGRLAEKSMDEGDTEAMHRDGLIARRICKRKAVRIPCEYRTANLEYNGENGSELTDPAS